MIHMFNDFLAENELYAAADAAAAVAAAAAGAGAVAAHRPCRVAYRAARTSPQRGLYRLAWR
jgi:hypothetical protein